jgi:hypothetical protein
LGNICHGGTVSPQPATLGNRDLRRGPWSQRRRIAKSRDRARQAATRRANSS